MEKHTIIINLKYSLQHGMANLNYQVDLILYQILKIILNIYLKNGEDIDKPSIQIYVNKIEIGLHLKLKMDIVLNF